MLSQRPSRHGLAVSAGPVHQHNRRRRQQIGNQVGALKLPLKQLLDRHGVALALVLHLIDQQTLQALLVAVARLHCQRMKPVVHLGRVVQLKQFPGTPDHLWEVERHLAVLLYLRSFDFLKRSPAGVLKSLPLGVVLIGQLHQAAQPHVPRLASPLRQAGPLLSARVALRPIVLKRRVCCAPRRPQR